jgi:leucyl-tRNA synthetase
MPGYAGSSWYFLRYMDPHNDKNFCDRTISDYWNQVDLYIGGTEHAVGHLLYSRMWTKALYDLGHIGFDEPFRKLLNQGMIQGSSRFVYTVSLLTARLTDDNEIYKDINLPRICISKKWADNYCNADIQQKITNLAKETIQKLNHNIDISTIGISLFNDVNAINVDVNIVDGIELDIEAFKKWRNGEYANAEFILEEGKYICGVEVEKMSKSKFNTVNPDTLVEKFGADTFRMYEMFLGPVDQSKPWDTKGIEGVHRFLKKLWRLFFDETKGKIWIDAVPTAEELKVLHRTIKKIEDDTERYSFNTAVSGFMICVNELSDLKCHKKEILEALLILITPYAPHIAEELWQQLGNSGSILNASYPVFNAAHVTETSKEYPVSINGKMRTNLTIALDATEEEVKELVLANELVQKWMEGKPLKKLIFVKGKMINVVV